MPTIHFIYAGDPDGGEIRSPYTITQSVFKYLKQKTQEIGWSLRYQNWTDGGAIDHGPNDIIIGHPNYDPNTVIQATFAANKPCLAKFTMHPLHTKDVNANYPFNHLAEQANGIFAICGPYWYDTLESTKFKNWKQKIIRLDMGIDTNHYPYLKTSFNNLRKLLYIGSSTTYKNLSYMIDIMKHLPNVQLHWYGGCSTHELSHLPNVRVVGNTHLNEEIAKRICNECDLMINVSDSDANPTTLLECASWGIPVACTKGSGYYGGTPFFEIPEDNVKLAASCIKEILHKPAIELEEISKRNRKLMETNYNWSIFCDKIWNRLLQVICTI